MITATRRHERLAYTIQGLEGLLREIAADHPVVVLQNLGLSWIPRWHYAVVIGYDMSEPTITLHSGTRPARRVALSTFMRTWQRANQWGLLVLDPGRMPASGEVSAYLKSAFGLQQAGFAGSAVHAFQTAVEAWPDDIDARMGLGNACYASGDLPSAAAAFQNAVGIAPEHAAALNNLAHVLNELGDLENAERHARKAVAIGGAEQKIYQQTLDEILLRKRQ